MVQRVVDIDSESVTGYLDLEINIVELTRKVVNNLSCGLSGSVQQNVYASLELCVDLKFCSLNVVR